MVQKAVSEDILRYIKTLLVWTESIEKDAQYEFYNRDEHNRKKSEISLKLEMVTRVLIDTLRNNPDGVPLAQLPNHLNKKLRFNLNVTELGFTKLKDLVLSVCDRIKIENRGSNHPFAVLINDPYHNSQSSFDEVYAYPPQYHQFGMYQIPPKEMKQSMYTQVDYEYHNKQGIGYPPMMPQGFYQPSMYTHVNYPQQRSDLRHDESFSSLHSINEHLNFNRNPNDEAYVPNAASLYGSVGGAYPHHLNISHCRNNTGPEIGIRHDNILLATKHSKQVNSHDFSLAGNRFGKTWLPHNNHPHDHLIEINSSGLLSEEDSVLYQNDTTESPDQTHTRTVSNLDEPDYNIYTNPYYMTFPEGINEINEINEISEERKSECDENFNSDAEELVQTVLDESAPVFVPNNMNINQPNKLIPKANKPLIRKTVPIVAVDAMNGTYK